MIGFNNCIIEAFWLAVFLLEYRSPWTIIHLITNIFHHEFAVFCCNFEKGYGQTIRHLGDFRFDHTHMMYNYTVRWMQSSAIKQLLETLFLIETLSHTSP